MHDNYNNKKVFVGIDVHKKKYIVVCCSEGEIVKKWSTAALPDNLCTQIKKYFKGAEIYSVYEAGFSGYVLHRKLVTSGISNIVINASSLEIATNDKVKTDRRDAKKMAVQLYSGRLKGIYIPTETEELSRLLSRHRENLIRARTKITLQIKSKLFQFGHLGPDDNPTASLKWIKGLQLKEFPTELKYVIEDLCDRWTSLTERLNLLKKELDEQAGKDDNDLIYKSVPGVGSVSSRLLSNELGDLSRFKNEKKLFCYLGLTPSEKSSGETRILGGITHSGSPRIRHILIQVAWRAIKLNPKLNSFFEKIAHRRGKQKAIVAVARKLIGHIRSCFVSGELYRNAG